MVEGVNNMINKYWKYILSVGVVVACFTIPLMTQIQIPPATVAPYDPAYYGWPNIIAGRRVLVVFNTEMNSCSPEHRKTIVVETLDTMTKTAPVNNKSTPSPAEVVLTLDPTGHTSIMERPFSTKDTLITDYLSQLEFFRTAGCAISGVALWPILGVTSEITSVEHNTPTPVAKSK